MAKRKIKNNMRKLEKQKLIQFGKENKNGRIYLESEFTRKRIWESVRNEESVIGSMLEKLNGCVYRMCHRTGIIKEEKIDFPIIGEFGHPEMLWTDLKNSTHYVENFKISKNWLVGDVIFLNTERGRNFEKVFDAKLDIVFRPRGTGVVNENKEVINYEVHAFDAIPKKDDAFL